jgi:Prolipoprotein diacylglyceryltransferase
LWEGGLSILGATIGAVLYAFYFLKKHRVPVLPLLDIGAIYAPVALVFGRLGCFFAGCCFGASCSLPWAVTYSNPEALAPLGVAIHPTQLYSSLFYVALFVAMRYFFSRLCHKPGQLLMLFLFFSTLERFLNDFLRADRIIDTTSSLVVTHALSLHQYLALGMLACAASGFIFISLRKK